MKSLELNLKERLLIVEVEPLELAKTTLSGCFFQDKKLEMICLGSELTEEIAEDLVNIFDLSYFVDYNAHSQRCYVDTALESFISAIQSKNYHWGQNPVKEPRMSDYGWYSSCSPEEHSGWMYEGGEEKYYEALKKHEDAESRTFNPEKTLIFKIM